MTGERVADFAVIGGGIVGLSTGAALLAQASGSRLLVIEKENAIATHQSGRNSGVIHSGIYYRPGSSKARFAIEGSQELPTFCREHDVAHEVCGKLIVATDERELLALDRLLERGLQHGLAVERVEPQTIREIEPHCAGIAAIRVPTAGICDYKGVCRAHLGLIEGRGGQLLLGRTVTGITHDHNETILHTNQGDLRTRTLINCAGLHCDRIARMDGVDPPARIVPFRGEYYELKPDKRHLCRHLIYPVPDPRFPFLGVHLTRMLDGSVHCGPNAVLALKREGYTWGGIDLRDTWDAVSYRGFMNLTRRHLRNGLGEVWRSLSKRAFTRSLQRLVPDLRQADLRPALAGVRAQALSPDGTMVDDFLIVRGERSVHVLNAPSPAATASIPIGRETARQALAESR